MLQHCRHRLAACVLSLFAFTPAPYASAEGIDDMLAAVRSVHGGTGPWAVAGYRIGQRALAELGLEAHSFDLEVRHRAPREVQYSCIIDGVQAATGASQGKLNLAMETADAASLATEVTHRKTGRRLVFRLKPELRSRIEGLPDGQLAAEGRRIAQMKDEELFTMEEAPRAR